MNTTLFADPEKIANLNEAKKLLIESRDAFFTLFNNSPICMSMTSVTPEKRIYFRANKKFAEIFGYAEQEIIGRTSVEVGILDEAESARVANILKENGRVQNEYIKCISKDKEVVHTISSIEKMVMNDGIYFVSFFINITRMIEQQNTIERQIAQLGVVNEQLEAFSYSVSHDLRAPLRAINGFAKMLETDFSSELSEEGINLLSKVQNNARKMSNLIDDLLMFARLGKNDIIKTTINMPLLVNEVLTELSSTDHKAKIHMKVTHDVKGDKALIKQVLINLISNSIKYSSKKEDPEIEIHSESKEQNIIYRIKDNGEGFSMNYAHKLFGVFQRLHSAEEFEGTGVGLATVKRIIVKHGGSVQAEGEPGKGAVFSFSLPAV
jgi:PAS domain S-box-containing protein